MSSCPRNDNDGGPELVSIELHFNGEYPGQTLRYHAHDIHEHAPEGTGEKGGESVDTAPYSFQYTGRHDHGSLPPVANPRGHYSALLTACQKAKEETEAILKPIVDKERGSKQSHGEEEEAKSTSSSSENSLDREIDNMDTDQDDSATRQGGAVRNQPDTTSPALKQSSKKARQG
eukprot:gb/GECG01008007.1/.p1 GENE.gb/GECG01008007.1/~~gb/GECG01008007.1/.p1  ORF type:complete len:175 (+),score=30.22 gb/GECG01008007.1/:1-525(+)